MDMKEIKRLVKLMSDNELRELNIEEGDKKIQIKRGLESAACGPMVPTMGQHIMPAPQHHGQVAVPAPVEAEPDTASDLHEITSPMVGTIYLASSPDTEDFVKVGDGIDSSSVVCIVEAMKVMNEIKAECRGTIAEICVENAQPIEFGQVLFRIKE